MFVSFGLVVARKSVPLPVEVSSTLPSSLGRDKVGKGRYEHEEDREHADDKV